MSATSRCIGLGLAAALLAASPAAATEWKIDAAKSWLGFKGTMAGGEFEGRFLRWEGRISFDPARPEQGRAMVTIDMASAKTGDPQKDDALPRSEWFDAKAFPAATFEVKSFRSQGGTSYEAVGTLTIRDVNKAVAMPTMIEVNGTTLHATGHLDLVRTDYGVGQGTGGQWVAPEVVAMFDVTARRQN